MNYKSINDLNHDIKKWITRLPNDLDLIVGIPRSGLLPANMIALYKNLPFTDTQGLMARKVFESGDRLDHARRGVNFDKKLKILVVDDSVCSGSQMDKTKSAINSAGLAHKILYATVYTTKPGSVYVNFYHEILDTPRFFEWNLMHHPWILKQSCVDLDGVLCVDPTDEENDDGVRYINFLRDAPPLIIPTCEIGWIVTCRLEKYRELTENWLARYNIKYDKLIMLDLPDKKSRLLMNNHAEYKTENYKATKALLFIESSRNQAEKIAKLSGKEVFCLETNGLIKPDKLHILLNNAEERKKITQYPLSIINRLSLNFFQK